MVLIRLINPYHPPRNAHGQDPRWEWDLIVEGREYQPPLVDAPIPCRGHVKGNPHANDAAMRAHAIKVCRDSEWITKDEAKDAEVVIDRPAGEER